MGENIKYWIYELNMPWEKKLEFDRICEQMGLPPDEFVEMALVDAIKRAADMKKDSVPDIQLARIYPVFKDETEAQALDRTILSEEESKNG